MPARGFAMSVAWEVMSISQPATHWIHEMTPKVAGFCLKLGTREKVVAAISNSNPDSATTRQVATFICGLPTPETKAKAVN